MEIKHELTRNDYVSANRFYSRKVSKNGKFMIVFYLIFGLVVVGYGGSIFFSYLNGDVVTVRGVLLFGGVALFICGLGIYLMCQAYLFPNSFSKKWAKKKNNQTAFLPSILTINEDGIKNTHDNGVAGFYTWGAIKRICEDLDFYLIEVLDRQLVIIGKRELKEAELAHIDDCISRYYSNEYQQY